MFALIRSLRTKENILLHMKYQGPHYLTKKGLAALRKEYADLCALRKNMTAGEVPEILHSEEANPEYIAFREDMSLLESKIAEYDNILRNYEIISAPPKSQRCTVQLGATVAVEVDGQIDEYTIVGSLEANPMKGRISNESPVGRALIGKKAEETVAVHSPTEVLYKIRKIRYTGSM